MKRLILACTLLLSGVIGAVGWAIASVQTVERGARSAVLGCFSGEDLIIMVLFLAMAAIGLALAVKELLNGEK